MRRTMSNTALMPIPGLTDPVPVPREVTPREDGRIDLMLDGRRTSASSGDLVRMPRGIPHAFFNNSGKTVTALFWAAPTGRLVDLYRRIHNMSSPAEVVQVADDYGVHFFPPVSSRPDPSTAHR